MPGTRPGMTKKENEEQMASLKDMRVRIAATKATQKITKAMQMVAAAKLRRAQAAAEAARPYAERMDAVLANVVSFEGSDASIVERIAAGEADAAIVYRSDLSSTAAGDLRAVTIPADANVLATYPIAVVEGSPNTDLALAFVDFVTSAAGQEILRRNGFAIPA